MLNLPLLCSRLPQPRTQTLCRFFIPDVEYLKDPQGLVAYVEAKVKLGHICPYCNGKGKTFHTYRALQQVCKAEKENGLVLSCLEVRKFSRPSWGGRTARFAWLVDARCSLKDDSGGGRPFCAVWLDLSTAVLR